MSQTRLRIVDLKDRQGYAMNLQDNPQFVGVEKLVRIHKAQIDAFEEWAHAGRWGDFHRNHYDWWAFPIDAPSSYGFEYSVSEESVQLLLANNEFITSLRKGAQLLMRSWGWDFESNSPVPHPQDDQEWREWPIRLYKCWRSMQIFGCRAEQEAVSAYAHWLKQNGETFEYRGEDLFSKISS